MKNIFCTTTAKTNEEYKNVIKNRMKIMVIFMVIGIITALAGLLGEFYFKAPLSDKTLGVYTGLGSSLFAAGLVLWIKNKLILNNEEKLRESRLNNTDERNQEISHKALSIATYVMIISLYIVGLIGGIFYPILFNVLSFIVCIFLLTYVIAYKYYNKKM
ncbi:hypothetical protein CLPUN_03540 [Clostridium puniceum]|uniref:DUF2178 domain-containing protein n=1 Tax=Clostridium puniceum TaxID=29367 RepID=A0A1S8TXS0_9CLOT|nr:hypothetical protein [Clostridium puniceum]OOM82215.1 hypothetical protein CLPUN_03540 [Clostridium puniceum]